MRNAEQFPDQPSDLTRVMPAYRRPTPEAGMSAGTGRIRYAHGGMLPRVGPFRKAPKGASGHHQGTRDGGAAGDIGGGGVGPEGVESVGALGGVGSLGRVWVLGQFGEFDGEAWSARFPVAGRQHDRWILVCGGIAAVAAFAAAFVASGGVPSHPATPSTVPAVVSQACPSPGTAPTP